MLVGYLFPDRITKVNSGTDLASGLARPNNRDSTPGSAKMLLPTDALITKPVTVQRPAPCN